MLATQHTTINNTTTITASEVTHVLDTPEVSKLAVSFNVKDGTSSVEDSELFTSILKNIDELDSLGSITPKASLAMRFLINRMKNYHSKVNTEDYNVVQSSNFLVYIPPKCRKYFINIAYHQETGKDSGKLISLWSWYSGKDVETGRPSYVYIVSNESYSRMNDSFRTVESELSHLKFQIENWNRLSKDALEMGNESLSNTYLNKVNELTVLKRSKMEQYVASVFNNLSFFDTLIDGKKHVISLAKRFVTFKDPRTSRNGGSKRVNKVVDTAEEIGMDDTTEDHGWSRNNDWSEDVQETVTGN
jgi:hypothetical protein